MIWVLILIMLERERENKRDLICILVYVCTILKIFIKLHIFSQKFKICLIFGTKKLESFVFCKRQSFCLKTCMYICFNLADRHPPKLVHCPADIYAVAGEKISWAIPKATDNVGIRDLWLEPNVHNGSQIGSGNHVFRYVAEDWHGNKAECRFIVSVIGSGTCVFVLYYYFDFLN